MTSEDFRKIIPGPGMVLVEVWDTHDPCTALTDQPCRILAIDPAYNGPLDVGMKVMVSQRHDVCHHHFPDDSRVDKTAALIRINSIVGVMKP